MLKALAWLVAALLTLLGVALAYLQYADLRAHAEWAAAWFLQRELEIGGAFEFDLLPTPRILAEDVSLTNASWGSAADMLRAGHLSARVATWSLFRGPVRVHDVNARNVRVLVETNADGASNWAPAHGATTDGPNAPMAIVESITGPVLPVRLERADISNVVVTVRAPDAPERRLTVDTLVVAQPQSGGQEVSLDASVMDMPLELRGRLTRQPGQDAELALTGALGPLTLAMEGTLGPASSLTATISTDDLAVLFDQLELDVALSGPLRMTAQIAATGEGFDVASHTRAGPLRAQWRAAVRDDAITFNATVANLAELAASFAVGGLPAADLRIGGRLLVDDDAVVLEHGTASIADAKAQFDLHLADGAMRAELAANGPRLADLGFDLPELPFAISTTVALDGAAVTLDPLRLEAGDSDLTGSLSVSSREPLKLIGRLQSDKLDLTPWRTPRDPAGSAAVGEATSERLFESTRLPFDRLSSANVDLELAVNELVEGNLHAHDVALSVHLAGGSLDGRLALRGPDGGQVRGQATLNASERPAQLTMQAQADAVRLNLMSGDVTSRQQIPPVGIRLDLQARGDSPRDLAASATGNVLFTQGSGRIDAGAAVPLLTGDLLTQLLKALNPFSRQTPYTNLECSVVLLALDDGTGKMPVMLMQDDKIRVIGQGTVDLNTEHLQLEFNTQPRQGIGVSADMFVTPFVMLSGTLTEPTIGMNKKGVLLHGGAAFLTGGLSLLGEALLDRAGAVRDHCAVAHAEANAILERR